MTRYTRHEEVPIFSQRESTVDAQRFNHVQLALRRIPGELRFELPGMRTLDMILQSDAWIIVDRALGDVPIAAWVEFSTQERTDLHTPIACKLRQFHAYAGLVQKQALEAMDQWIDAELDLPDSDSEDRIVPFKRDE